MLRSGTSLVVPCLRLCAPNAGGPSSFPGQGTRSCRPQLRGRMLGLKIPKVNVTQSCLTLCEPWTIQSMEFSRPEDWSG